MGYLRKERGYSCPQQFILSERSADILVRSNGLFPAVINPLVAADRNVRAPNVERSAIFKGARIGLFQRRLAVLAANELVAKSFHFDGDDFDFFGVIAPENQRGNRD